MVYSHTALTAQVGQPWFEHTSKQSTDLQSYYISCYCKTNPQTNKQSQYWLKWLIDDHQSVLAVNKRHVASQEVGPEDSDVPGLQPDVTDPNETN